MSIADTTKKELLALNKAWEDTHDPMAVMRLHILQDYEEIRKAGYERQLPEASDFDSPEYITPKLTDEEYAALQTLHDQLKAIENAWKIVCEIEEKFL